MVSAATLYFMHPWLQVIYPYLPGISAVGMIVNLMHISVLTRKEMRNSSTNVIMLWIAISDLLYTSAPVFDGIVEEVDSWRTCYIPDSYAFCVFGWVYSTIRDDAKRSAVFLGLSIAMIRVIVIRNPMSKSVDLTSAKAGWNTSFGVLLFSSVISVFYFLRYKVLDMGVWTPNRRGCNESDFPANYSLPRYIWTNSNSTWIQAYDSLYVRAYLFLDGLVSMILPAVLFPIVTFILIHELRKASKNRDRLFSDKKKDKSTLQTRLVTYMTISFMCVGIPMGVFYLWQSNCTTNACAFAAANGMYFCDLLIPINTITHFLICMLVSTQYQTTVKGMLRMKEKDASSSNTVSTVSGRRSPRTN